MNASSSKPELLAPAGGWEQLQAAIHFGADAVYLAADRFGLRQRAGNFSLDEMPQAVTLAHEAGVRVHATCNIYMNDEDAQVLPDYLKALDAAGVDAVLVSDLGALRLAREHAPNMDIHVSTQAAVSNAQAAMVWHDLGAKRIVVAREMSLEAIARMHRELPDTLELEAFAHGAMCMAISGRCLISDYLTGRSANHGHCTQPCRWSYRLEEESRPGQYFPVEEDDSGTYLMNSADMCMLPFLDDMAAAGIDSIKIEGRNKKAFYVATVVNAYRQVLDGAPASDFMPELETISHRPYSTGFFFGSAQQSTHADEYLQTHDLVATVDNCVALQNGYRTTIACRNRFFEGDTLEVLTPGSIVRTAVVEGLVYEGSGPDDVERTGVANRAMGVYSFSVPFEVQRGDMFRKRREQEPTESTNDRASCS